MEKKRQYINPQCKVIIANMENIMFQASPGVGADYEDGMVLDAKRYEEPEWDLESIFIPSDGSASPFGQYL